MQPADFLSAVFFYLKVGENLNQNWIVENLNNAFSTWNGKLGELWGLVTTGPQTFKGGAVWSVMQTLHNGMVGIGYALVVLFFAISLCKNTMNVQPGKYPEERTIPNTLKALQELVGGDIECCYPWRDRACVVCNSCGKIDGLTPNRMLGPADYLAGSFLVCAFYSEDFVSLSDKQIKQYEKLYHYPIAFLPTPHGLLPMKCTPEQYEQFQRDGNKLKIRPIDHGER